jgi:hypothetical protein
MRAFFMPVVEKFLLSAILMIFSVSSIFAQRKPAPPICAERSPTRTERL